MAARCASSHAAKTRAMSRRRARSAARARNGQRDSTLSKAIAGSSRASTPAARAFSLFSPGPRRRESGRRLWRGRQGQHFPQCLRHDRRGYPMIGDRSHAKQGKFLPGSHPHRRAGNVGSEAGLSGGLAVESGDEIRDQFADSAGAARFVTAVPETRCCELSIRATEIPGVFAVRGGRIVDERGFFARLYCPDEFAKAGIDFTSTQTNLSRTRRKHTLRGMHCQDAPLRRPNSFASCAARSLMSSRTSGRRVRPTGRGSAPTLSQENGEALFIPRGCAHGFITLADDTDCSTRWAACSSPDTRRGFASTIPHSQSSGRMRRW